MDPKPKQDKGGAANPSTYEGTKFDHNHPAFFKSVKVEGFYPLCEVPKKFREGQDLSRISFKFKK